MVNDEAQSVREPQKEVWGPCESCNASTEGCQFYWQQRGPCCGSDCLHIAERA